jgi:uncharacterized metal-binding protein YceD (DUF177 family)
MKLEVAGISFGGVQSSLQKRGGVHSMGGMKVHVLQVPLDGKRYEGEMPSDVLELNDDRVRSTGPIQYALDVGVSDGGLWARGSVSTEVECECVRCLERFRRLLEAPEFACQVELHGKEMVDLTEYLREDILLALPAHPYCDWDGKKVCKASFSTAAVEPLDDHRDAWKALEKLKL